MRKYELARELGRAEQYIEELIKDGREVRGDTLMSPDETDAVGWAHPGTQAKAALDRAINPLPVEARIPVLAVALMLKNKADAADIAEGADVERILSEYERVQRFHTLLGPTTDEERAAASALWDETAA